MLENDTFVTEADQPRARDTLAGLLWPETPETVVCREVQVSLLMTSPLAAPGTARAPTPPH